MMMPDKKAQLKTRKRTGLWCQPILTVVVLVLYIVVFDGTLSVAALLICALVSLAAVIYIETEQNTQQRMKADTERPKAQYPAIPDALKRKVPTEGDIVFGSLNGVYAATRLESDFHSIIIGGSGSGKSSAEIIPNMLLNTTSSVFAIDIKGELSEKTQKLGDGRVHIFNPQDRECWGFDPLYLLTGDSSEQDIFETMQTIAHSLLPKPTDVKDPFWIDSARSMLISFLIYAYKNGKDTLVDIVDEILSRPAKDLITEIIDSADEGSNERKMIIQYADFAGGQGGDATLGGIVVQMSNALTVFSTDEDIRYAFGSNPRKIKPTILNEGESIFVVIKDEKLDGYSTILQLIINLTLGELMKREESVEAPVWVVIDELPRLLATGRLDKLLTSIKVCRSKKVRMTLVTQSLEALRTAYSENEVVDLLSNCNYKVVLDASSSKTQKMVCDMAGTYKERKLSSSNGSKQSKSMTTSYEEKKIIREADLITLAQTGEAILLTPYGYLRVEKTPYYSDNHFKQLAEKVCNYNENVKALSKTGRINHDNG